jgi:ABC-type glycerol-3-phosphate transport system substrate-binding protein
MKRSVVTRIGVAALAVVMVASFPGCNKKKGSGIVDEVANSENAKNAVFKEAYPLNLDFTPSAVRSAGDQIMYFASHIDEDKGGPLGDVEVYEKEINLAEEVVDESEGEGKNEGADPAPEDAEGEGVGAEDGEGEGEGEGEEPEEQTWPSYTAGWAFGDLEGNVGRTVTYAPICGDADVSDFALLDNGNIALIENHWVISDEEYYVEKHLVIVSKDGKEISRAMLTGTQDTYVDNFNVLSDGTVVANTDTSVVIFSKDGKKTGEIKVGQEEYVMNIVAVTDGTIYAFVQDSEKNTARVIDLASKSFGETKELPDTDFYNLMVAPGHDFYARGQNGVTAFDFATNEKVEIMNFLDSDMYRENIYTISVIDEQTIYVSEEDIDKDDGSIKGSIYKKVDPKDVKDKTIITLGGLYVGDSDLNRMIIKFNKQSSEYRIRTINYDDFATVEDYGMAEKQFRNDVLTKSGPDIVLLSGLSNPGIYMKKKVFADLYPMMSGAGINKEDYLQNVLDAGSIDGRLYAFIPKFTVTGYAMKQSLIPGKASVSVADIRALEEQYNVTGKSVPYGYREQIIYNAIALSGKEYYDADTGKCNFDSEDFIALLEWANTFPIAEEAFDDESAIYSYNEQGNMFRANKLLLTDMGISSFREFNSREKELFGEDIVFFGFPNSNGTEGGVLYDDMSLAISSASKNKDAAFEFVKLFMMEDYQMPEENQYYSYGFPCLKSAFDQAGEYAQERMYWIDSETGEKEYYEDTYYDEKTGKDYPITPISDERLAYIKDRIMQCNTLRSYDEEIINLVNEEASAYFAGEKSAEEVARIIQSRVSIYVRENQ